jgi:hypothetical protein
MNETIINIGIFVTYALVAVAVVTTVFFGIFHMIKNFGKAKTALVGVVILVAIFLITYAISTNEVYPNFNVGPTASQMIGGGITTTFVLVGLAVLAAVYSEVSKLFK